MRQLPSFLRTPIAVLLTVAGLISASAPVSAAEVVIFAVELYHGQTGDTAKIFYAASSALAPGQFDSFQELTREMVEFTRTEPGVLADQRCITEDGRFVHVYERYADSAAAVAHLHNFASKFADRFLLMVDRKRFAVHGAPNAELRLLLARFGAVYLTPFGRDRA